MRFRGGSGRGQGVDGADLHEMPRTDFDFEAAQYPRTLVPIVDDMVARGAEISDVEIETIIDYLANNFGPKVNVNKASAEELAGVLEIPTATADAIVEYRAKNGNFKDIEDLKKVRALGKDIDSKKDRLVFVD